MPGKLRQFGFDIYSNAHYPQGFSPEGSVLFCWTTIAPCGC